MSVTRLVPCCLCSDRVDLPYAVTVAGYEAHEACAEAHYRRLAEAVHAEGGND